LKARKEDSKKLESNDFVLSCVATIKLLLRRTLVLSVILFGSIKLQGRY